ncbi:MAG: HTH domain-containing protein [Gammaproteobacteria bacterium]
MTSSAIIEIVSPGGPEDGMEKDEIESAVLHAFEVSLEAQLRAVRRLRAGPPEPKAARRRTSQIEMVHDVLQRAGKPLHVSEIIERVQKLHGFKLERESIVSTLVKKVNRSDRFVRTDKNVFGLKGGE